jgi:hypothetical protein
MIDEKIQKCLDVYKLHDGYAKYIYDVSENYDGSFDICLKGQKEFFKSATFAITQIEDIIYAESEQGKLW